MVDGHEGIRDTPPHREGCPHSNREEYGEGHSLFPENMLFSYVKMVHSGAFLHAVFEIKDLCIYKF